MYITLQQSSTWKQKRAERLKNKKRRSFDARTEILLTWEWRTVDKVCVCIFLVFCTNTSDNGAEVLLSLSSLYLCLCPLCPTSNLYFLWFVLPIFVFSLGNKRHSIGFHTFQPMPLEQVNINRQKDKKKVKLLIWCQRQLEQKELRSSRKEREEGEKIKVSRWYHKAEKSGKIQKNMKICA